MPRFHLCQKVLITGSIVTKYRDREATVISIQPNTEAEPDVTPASKFIVQFEEGDEAERLNQVRRIAGGYMRRRTIVSVGAALVGLFLFLMQAQAQLTIHAASDQPVPGWDRMKYNKQAVWVSPTVSLTSADILWAESSTRPDGARSVGVLFTDAGAKKMTELSHAQLSKLIAMVLDGKVIFAPKVRDEIGAQALITGKAPRGLPEEVAQRIVDSVKKN